MRGAGTLPATNSENKSACEAMAAIEWTFLRWTLSVYEQSATNRAAA